MNTSDTTKPDSDRAPVDGPMRDRLIAPAVRRSTRSAVTTSARHCIGSTPNARTIAVERSHALQRREKIGGDRAGFGAAGQLAEGDSRLFAPVCIMISAAVPSAIFRPLSTMTMRVQMRSTTSRM